MSESTKGKDSSSANSYPYQCLRDTGGKGGSNSRRRGTKPPSIDERSFEGKYYRIERPLNLPQSLSRPHPPILIAGSGEHKTLRLVARYADACNLQPGPQILQKLEVLRQYCEAESRDYDAIEKTCMFALDAGEDGSKVDDLIGQLRWLASIEIIGREILPAVVNL